MEINDNLIIEKFFGKKGKLNGNHSTREYLEKNCPEILEYLLNRYPDSESLRETFLRIFFHIEKRPQCPICGETVKWRGKRNKLFADTCGKGSCYCKVREKTMIQKYGVPQLAITPEVIEKIKKTKKERYGDEFFCNIEKRIKTNLAKYGQVGAVSEEIIAKRKKTCKERFGYESAMQSDVIKDKVRQTCLLRYGVDNYRKTEECLKKIVESKKRNGTANTSKYERNAYQWLIEYYGPEDIVAQYKDERYKNPINGHTYHCDFYIRSKDLFIELQIFWGHGPHPFNENDKNDIALLEEIKEKIKEKPIYQRLVNCWTKDDVCKRQVAKLSGIKLLEVYDRQITKEKLIKLIEEKCYDNI